jgi:hypothetical protein
MVSLIRRYGRRIQATSDISLLSPSGETSDMALQQLTRSPTWSVSRCAEFLPLADDQCLRDGYLHISCTVPAVSKLSRIVEIGSRVRGSAVNQLVLLIRQANLSILYYALNKVLRGPYTINHFCATQVCPFTIKSINTIHGQPVAQHAMLRNMIDRVWAPLRFCRFWYRQTPSVEYIQHYLDAR